jgi:hypothetical protein
MKSACRTRESNRSEAFDYKLIDQSALEIVRNAKRSGAGRPRAGAAADEDRALRTCCARRT